MKYLSLMLLGLLLSSPLYADPDSHSRGNGGYHRSDRGGQQGRGGHDSGNPYRGGQKHGGHHQNGGKHGRYYSSHYGHSKNYHYAPRPYYRGGRYYPRPVYRPVYRYAPRPVYVYPYPAYGYDVYYGGQGSGYASFSYFDPDDGEFSIRFPIN